MVTYADPDTKEYFDFPDRKVSVIKSVTNANSFTDPVLLDPSKPASLSVSGTFTATARLLRSFDGGTTWHSVFTSTTPAEILFDTSGPYPVLWKAGVNTGDFTSGTVEVGIYQ